MVKKASIAVLTSLIIVPAASAQEIQGILPLFTQILGIDIQNPYNALGIIAGFGIMTIANYIILKTGFQRLDLLDVVNVDRSEGTNILAILAPLSTISVLGTGYGFGLVEGFRGLSLLTLLFVLIGGLFTVLGGGIGFGLRAGAQAAKSGSEGYENAKETKKRILRDEDAQDEVDDELDDVEETEREQSESAQNGDRSEEHNEGVTAVKRMNNIIDILENVEEDMVEEIETINTALQNHLEILQNNAESQTKDKNIVEDITKSLDQLNQVTYEVNQRVQSPDTTDENLGPGVQLLGADNLYNNPRAPPWKNIEGLVELGGIIGMRNELNRIEKRINQVYTDAENEAGTLGKETTTVIRVANEAVEISKNARRLKEELSMLQDEINFEEKLDRSEKFKELYEKAEEEDEIMQKELEPTLEDINDGLVKLESTFETVIEELENHMQLSKEFIDDLENETSQSKARTKAKGLVPFVDAVATLADNVVNITNNLGKYENTDDLRLVLGSSRSGEDGCIYDVLTDINDKAKELEQGLDEEYKKDSEKIQSIEQEYQELENILSG
ncbi:hypothetical protein GLU60_03845 [Nanohaloarchaea archaeon H01]|jgi:hypothetical protein|nr:hypothetical protein [Nanohaloarchaea archaeon H01]